MDRKSVRLKLPNLNGRWYCIVLPDLVVVIEAASDRAGGVIDRVMHFGGASSVAVQSC
jgi:hypothetical protein